MELNERIAKLEVKEKELRQDVADIKLQVTNHIPTQISRLSKVVYELRDNQIASAAVRTSWDINMKRAVITIGIIWTILRIIEVFIK